MKIAIAAIGLLKTGPEKDMAADYEKRIQALGRQAGLQGPQIQDWPESRLGVAEQRKQDEARQLWSVVPEGTLAFVLDERGKALSSEDFAKRLKAEADRGMKQVTFLIGGPDGHAAETRKKAQETICFGPMTWPHRMVRVMLLEQIYRAVTIMVNHPYHRA